MRTPSRGLAAAAVGLAAAGCLVCPALAAAAPAAAAAVAAVGTATASGVRYTFTIPGYLVVDPIADAAVPASQAQLNTASASGASFASLPYPGDTVVNAPALVSVLTGGSFPLSYPAYAHAKVGDQPSIVKNEGAGLNLTATATEAAVQGTATESPQGATTTMRTDTTSVTNPDGSMTVTGDSLVQGLTLGGGVLTIGEVHTHAVTTIDATDAKPVTKQTTAITGMSVAGIPVSYGPDGLSLPGAGPLSPAPLLTTVNAALAGAGLTLKPPTATPFPEGNGVDVSALEIDGTQQTPLPNSAPANYQLRFGNVMTSAIKGARFGGIGRGLDFDPVVTGTSPTPGGSGPSATPPPTAASRPSHKAAASPSHVVRAAVTPAANPAASGPPPAAGGGVDTAAAPALAPSATGGTTGGDGASAPALAAAQEIAPTAVRAAASPLLLARSFASPVRFFYAVLLLGAICLLACTAAMKSKGVRATWTS